MAADFVFHREWLNPARRQPGISGFMRVRNGADFLERVVESHLPFFDEIVIVYNQCTDRTPEIAGLLANRHPGKVREIHYEPRVHPPGSDAHRREPPDSPHSYVNYHNYSLAATTRQIVSKLDDDHIAMPRAFELLSRDLRRWPYEENAMICFSGFNLIRDAAGAPGILADDPFSGNGDIGFFRASEESCFAWDPRFARFQNRHLRRRYHSLVYWHLKFLKTGQGFANYELDRNPNSRYQKRYVRFLQNQRAIGLDPFLRQRLLFQFFSSAILKLTPAAARGKWSLRWERFAQLHASVSREDREDLRRQFDDWRPQPA